MFGLGQNRELVQEPAEPFDSRHTSGVREGIQVAAVVWIAGFILFSLVEMTWLPRFAKIVLVLSIGAVAGVMLAQWLRRMNANAASWRNGVAFANVDKTDPRNGGGEAVRAAREAETQKQLAEQKAKLIERLRDETEDKQP